MKSKQRHERLSRDEQAALDFLMPLLELVARQQSIRVRRVDMSRFIDPEDDSEEIVLTQWIEAEPQLALDYWDTLGETVQDRIDSLPDNLRRIANERVAVEVRWIEDG